MQTMCTASNLFSKNFYRGRNNTKFYISDKYKFAYCKVPKGGSTFWTQAFAVLKYGAGSADEVFNQRRSHIQSILKRKFLTDFQNVLQRNTGTILVSRDPYSRLYSAFIDKAYLPLMLSVGIEALKFDGKLTDNTKITVCPNDVTFEQFVRWVINKAKSGETLNRHWAPIYSLCRPCDVKSWMLVKLETFSKDVEYALRELGVETDKLASITDALHAHRIDTTIPGIVSTVLSQKAKVRECFGTLGVEERLWQAFKIQGFLKENVPFPKTVFQNLTSRSNVKNYDKFNDIILKAIRQHPLTSEESKQQRKRAVVDAYSTFSQETIRGIQEVYYVDFMLYNYSFVPPSMSH